MHVKQIKARDITRQSKRVKLKVYPGSINLVLQITSHGQTYLLSDVFMIRCIQCHMYSLSGVFNAICIHGHVYSWSYVFNVKCIRWQIYNKMIILINSSYTLVTLQSRPAISITHCSVCCFSFTYMSNIVVVDQICAFKYVCTHWNKKRVEIRPLNLRLMVKWTVWPAFNININHMWSPWWNM